MDYWESPDYWQNLEKLTALHQPRITRSFDETIVEFNEKHNDMMYLYRKSDMASNMHAHLRGRIKANFHGVPGAYTYDEPPHAFVLILDGYAVGIPVILVIKFKKQAKNLRTANIQTSAVKDFNSQKPVYLKYLPEVQMALFPDFEDKVTNPPKESNLIAGYTPHPTWTKYDRRTLSFPIGNGKYKVISEIRDLDAETRAKVVELPTRTKQLKPKRVHRKQSQSKATRTKLRKFIPQEESQRQDNIQDTRKKKQ